MQDKTINNALLALHKAGGEQANLARQLLRMRGIEPPRLVSRCSNPFRRNQMRRAILEALRDGPQTGPEIVRHVMRYRDGWTFKDAQRRVSTALTKMKSAGMVRREGRVWLAPVGPNHYVFTQVLCCEAHQTGPIGGYMED